MVTITTVTRLSFACQSLDTANGQQWVTSSGRLWADRKGRCGAIRPATADEKLVYAVALRSCDDFNSLPKQATTQEKAAANTRWRDQAQVLAHAREAVAAIRQHDTANGLATVPRKLTDEMMEAGAGNNHGDRNAFVSAYNAALAVAPAPPGADECSA